MNLDQFITTAAEAIFTIFGVTAAITYNGHGQDNPTTLTFVVENPTANPDFEWTYEINPTLIANSEEYRTSALSGIANRVLSDSLNQWLSTQNVRPIKQPIDRV